MVHRGVILLSHLPKTQQNPSGGTWLPPKAHMLPTEKDVETGGKIHTGEVLHIQQTQRQAFPKFQKLEQEKNYRST